MMRLSDDDGPSATRQAIEVTNVNIRTQRHGEELVPALDVAYAFHAAPEALRDVVALDGYSGDLAELPCWESDGFRSARTSWGPTTVNHEIDDCVVSIWGGPVAYRLTDCTMRVRSWEPADGGLVLVRCSIRGLWRRDEPEIPGSLALLIGGPAWIQVERLQASLDFEPDGDAEDDHE